MFRHNTIAQHSNIYQSNSWGSPLKVRATLLQYYVAFPYSFSPGGNQNVCNNMLHVSPYIPIHNFCITALFFRRSLTTGKVHKFSENP